MGTIFKGSRMYFRTDGHHVLGVGGPYETTNVRWTAPIGGMAEPIVVGERLLLLSEPYDLVSLDKTTGKILWARSVNYFEATPEADRKGNRLFDEAANSHWSPRTVWSRS